MSYRKSGFSYILWALYGLTVCIVFTMQARTACLLLGLEEAHWYLLTAAGSILVLFFLLYLPLQLLAGRIAENGRGTGKIKMWEIPVLILVVALSLALRLWLSENAVGAAWQLGERIPEGFPALRFPFSELTFSSLYAWLNLFLAGAAGTDTGIPQLIRILLETAGIFLLYPAIRTLSGKTAAVTVTGALAFLPVFLGASYPENGNGLLLPVSAVLLLLTALYLKKLSGRGSSASVCVSAILCGILSGAAVFLDPIFFGFLLLPLWASFFIDGPERPGRRIAGFFTLLFFAAAGFAALALMQAGLLEQGIWSMLLNRFSLPGHFSVHGLWKAVSGGWLFWMFPILCFCFFYIFGFFDQRGNLGSVWLPSFLFVSFYCFLIQGGQEEDGAMITLLFWLVFAGMGIHSACCKEMLPRRRRKKKKRRTLPAAALASSEAGPSSPSPESLPEEPLPGEPIANPLPGPRKHVHKQMDYAFEPEEREMHFDIEQVEEGDDFDYP